ncbi:MAG: Trk system potassium transporter TrkA [Firmicutes bacterium]|nr:Trk system potassium transporter TrkA [Bacillota bacterium]MCM1401379.1 Trk system potassium transporter TrkA [Bacteroides sp.]MCM1477872.1 Trk system potassium transporter TrkA [Bacteroides sp.]
MKIVIAGAGEVGSHLARLLSRENLDIIIIDANQSKVEKLDSSCNLLAIIGQPTSAATLKQAIDGYCDLFIAVTPEETTNVISCMLAKNFGARRTVARIDNYEFMQPENARLFATHGVDAMIYPEFLAAKEVLKSLERNWVRNWFELHDGELIVVGVKIRDNAFIVGQTLRQISATNHFYHVSAIKRNQETIIPGGNDLVQAGDIIYFTTTREHIEGLRQICGKTKTDIRKVLIMGGSRIAVRLLALAGDKYRFRIIEVDRDRCEYLAERCPDARISCGDARSVEMLMEEGISEMDAFVALTDSSETNILTCLTAKEYGVKKTIAEVENIQFISQAENLNIGTILNKKLLASGKIFQMLLDADVESSKFMALADADVAEIEAKPRSKVTRAAVKDLNLSRDMTIAGLIRNGKGMLVSGNTVIQSGDHVLVFCLANTIHKIERLFN